jgi:hypothetical protein
MSSARRIAANRDNARKSTGPRTRRGKSRASRNAVRHGLSATNFGGAGLAKEVARLAKAICPDLSDPFRYEQAVIIAESQVMLTRVRAARVSALESPRTPGADTLGQELHDGLLRVRLALPELLSLERYERRALSRRKRAIRRFDALGHNIPGTI